MRNGLNLLYRGSGALAALFIVAICALIALQVLCNVLNEAYNKIDGLIVSYGGESLGWDVLLQIPSYAEFTGFFLAAASFLALAYTLRAGGHIRVSLIIQHCHGGLRRYLELWCITVAGALSGYFTYYMASLVMDSLAFGDVSVGMVPVALWIPQSTLTFGLAVLTIALVDEFAAVLRGEEPNYDRGDDFLLGAEGAEVEISDSVPERLSGDNG